jgi:hypothetical protein
MVRCSDVVMALKKFQILEHFESLIFRLQMFSLYNRRRDGSPVECKALGRPDVRRY